MIVARFAIVPAVASSWTKLWVIGAGRISIRSTAGAGTVGEEFNAGIWPELFFRHNVVYNIRASNAYGMSRLKYVAPGLSR